MKLLKFFAVGILFGLVMTKSEAISWFRIQEMFHFDSFHMFGIIGSAVVFGAIGIYLLKKKGFRSMMGKPLQLDPKKMEIKRLLLGGTVFGLGWAMTGACPGPLYVLLGQGAGVILVVIASAIFGAYMYGVFKARLPH